MTFNETETNKRTALFDLHVTLGARLVPFAGYAMPVQYPTGVLREHLHTRTGAGLFDISHMGQIVLQGDEDVREQFEKLVPGDIQGLRPGGMRYSFFLNEAGGVLDDIMITRPAAQDQQNKLFLVVNAACKKEDFAYIQKQLPSLKIDFLEDRALLALQGPKAAMVLGRFCAAPNRLQFMQADTFLIEDVGHCFISRSGYTGEDGFEISVPAHKAKPFAQALLEQSEVLPIGLGARDSLRLEAGLCLYGHDLDTTTTPIEADLTWAIGKRRRLEGGFMGDGMVQEQLKNGVTRKRVGLRPEGKALAREQTKIINDKGETIGLVSSGGFGPTLNGPICMGYVETPYAENGAPVFLLVRGNVLPAKIVKLPFVPHHYVKG